MKVLKIFVVALFLVGLLLTFCEGATAQKRESLQAKYILNFRIDERQVVQVNFLLRSDDRLQLDRVYDLTPAEDGWKVTTFKIDEETTYVKVFNSFDNQLVVPEEIVLLQMTTFDRTIPSAESVNISNVEFVIDRDNYSIWLDDAVEVLAYPRQKVSKFFLPLVSKMSEDITCMKGEILNKSGICVSKDNDDDEPEDEIICMKDEFLNEFGICTLIEDIDEDDVTCMKGEVLNEFGLCVGGGN